MDFAKSILHGTKVTEKGALNTYRFNILSQWGMFKVYDPGISIPGVFKK